MNFVELMYVCKAMLLLFSLIYGFLLRGVELKPENCVFADNCNAEDNNFDAITCEHDNSCSCTIESPLNCSELDFNILTAEYCINICESIREVCKFYKWREIRDRRYCYLMSESQCDDFDDYPCDTDHCVSGGVNCSDHTCPVSELLTTHGDPSDNYLPWSCFSYDEEGHISNIDIYNQEVSQVDNGTSCVAKHRYSLLNRQETIAKF